MWTERILRAFFIGNLIRMYRSRCNGSRSMSLIIISAHGFMALDSDDVRTGEHNDGYQTSELLGFIKIRRGQRKVHMECLLFAGRIKDTLK